MCIQTIQTTLCFNYVGRSFCFNEQSLMNPNISPRCDWQIISSPRCFCVGNWPFRTRPLRFAGDLEATFDGKDLPQVAHLSGRCQPPARYQAPVGLGLG